MKLFIGTPVLTSVKIDYHISMIETVIGLEISGIDYQIEHVIGCSLVEDARNELVHRFLETDCTHLLFIDSDMSWDVGGIKKLLQNSHLDIVGGIYSKKKIADYPIYSDSDTGTLDTHMFYNDTPIIDRNLPICVNYLSTGFTMISKNVFIEFLRKFPDRKYKVQDKEMFLFFSCELVKEEMTHYGEDVNFCRLAKIIGFKCFAIPSIELAHIGDFSYKKVLQ